jgi:hypothetical protein
MVARRQNKGGMWDFISGALPRKVKTWFFVRERYRVWCGRHLDEHDLVYLFLDPPST